MATTAKPSSTKSTSSTKPSKTNFIPEGQTDAFVPTPASETQTDAPTPASETQTDAPSTPGSIPEIPTLKVYNKVRLISTVTKNDYENSETNYTYIMFQVNQGKYPLKMIARSINNSDKSSSQEMIDKDYTNQEKVIEERIKVLLPQKDLKNNNWIYTHIHIDNCLSLNVSKGNYKQVLYRADFELFDWKGAGKEKPVITKLTSSTRTLFDSNPNILS